MNEKGIVERAGLGEVNVAIALLDLTGAVDRVARLLAVDWI